MPDRDTEYFSLISDGLKYSKNVDKNKRFDIMVSGAADGMRLLVFSKIGN